MATEQPDGAMTVEEARDLVAASLDAGIRCPTCGQWCKRYNRKLNSGMARSLIRFYRAAPAGEWVTFKQAHVQQNHEYAKLALWELIEPQTHSLNQSEEGAMRGWWRVTAVGVEFVLGRTTVARFAIVYDGEVEGYSAEQTTIRQALGDRFDYDELMAGAVTPVAMEADDDDE